MVARLLWEKPPGQFRNFISGCCAVGSAPALGAGGPGFESPHSDHLSQKNRRKRRFFCILSSGFVVLEIAALRRFRGQKSGGHMSENSGRIRQIPNPSLIGAIAGFSLRIRQILEFSRLILYNSSTVDPLATKVAVWNSIRFIFPVPNILCFKEAILNTNISIVVQEEK